MELRTRYAKAWKRKEPSGSLGSYMPKDVAIIGGSAAGLLTAYLLAQRGLQVRLFEASDSVAPPRRTLIATNYLSGLIGPLCEGIAINKIRQYELFADGRSTKISLRRPDLIIERSKLIHSLAVLAEESGAQILTGRRFLSMETNGRQLNFILSRNDNRWPVEESADIIVGADGALSKVAQSAGWPKQSTESVFQAVVELPKDMTSETTRVWFAPENTSYFYWLIPHSPTQGVLGVIGTEERKARGDLQGFLARNALVPIEFQTASVPRYTYRIRFHRKMKGCHVYLVGDAAGHVKASTVGGLVTGFRGAIGVAEAILNGGSSRQFKALRLELDLHYLIRKGLNCFTLADYVRLLDLLSPSVKHSLSLFNRDDTGRLLCHVFFRQPRLLLLGLRSLLTGQ